MTTTYERAGVTASEVEHLGALVGAVEAADPMAAWVAVRRADLLGVVGALDRLVDEAAGSRERAGDALGADRRSADSGGGL